jgi:CheY-like chemotaxis protein
VVGDPGRLRQILINLIGNAIKFTERGEVVVRIELETQTSDAVCLHFTVQDTGIGIPAAKQRLIFEPFTQADGSTTRHYGGTGLGLAISSQLVHLMGGRIWVDSEVGKGSVFHFTARFAVQPVRAAVPAPVEPATSAVERTPLVSQQTPAESPQCFHILLAEDNVVNQRLAVRILEKEGHTVIVAPHGEAVLAALKQETFDLVLMDVQMPIMGGFETTAAIRAQERATGAHIPIIAMTAHAMKGDREKCLAAGMDDYLAKPIKAEELYAAIARYAARQPEPRAAIVASPVHLSTALRR